MPDGSGSQDPQWGLCVLGKLGLCFRVEVGLCSWTDSCGASSFQIRCGDRLFIQHHGAQHPRPDSGGAGQPPGLLQHVGPAGCVVFPVGLEGGHDGHGVQSPGSPEHLVGGGDAVTWFMDWQAHPSQEAVAVSSSGASFQSP